MTEVDPIFDKSLYVACALNSAPQDYVDDVAYIKSTLEDEGINVLHFLGLGDFTPLEIYRWDIVRCVGNCSAFLGIYGNYSDGRGFETSQAFMRGIPMLGVAKKGENVTKIITGAYEEHRRPFLWVDDLRSEVPRLAIREFVEIQPVL